MIAVFFALASAILTFYALIYPAWFQQTYKETEEDVFQGFGLWVFESTADLTGPFYASETTLSYPDLCDLTNDEFPNWMLGAGAQYQSALCGSSILIIQIITVLAAFFSIAVLVGSIAAVFKVDPGYPERIVSGGTLIGSLLLSLSLILWGWTVQKNLYEISTINTSYQTCKASFDDWSCWFYGNSFWVALAAVIAMSITGYVSAAGRTEKLKRYRKEFEDNMQAAMQASIADASRMSAVIHAQYDVQNQSNDLASNYPVYTIAETPNNAAPSAPTNPAVV